MNAYKFHLEEQRKVKEFSFHEIMHCCSRLREQETAGLSEREQWRACFLLQELLSAVGVCLWRELILVETDHCLSGLFSLWNHTASSGTRRHVNHPFSQDMRCWCQQRQLFLEAGFAFELWVNSQELNNQWSQHQIFLFLRGKIW